MSEDLRKGCGDLTEVASDHDDVKDDDDDDDDDANGKDVEVVEQKAKPYQWLFYVTIKFVW